MRQTGGPTQHQMQLFQWMSMNQKRFEDSSTALWKIMHLLWSMCSRWRCCWVKQKLWTAVPCFSLQFWSWISSPEMNPRFPGPKEEDKYGLFLILFNRRFLYHNRNSFLPRLLPGFLDSISKADCLLCIHQNEIWILQCYFPIVFMIYEMILFKGFIYVL